MFGLFSTSSSNETKTYNTTNTYDGSFNTNYSSARTFENVGNPVLNLGLPAATGGSSSENLLMMGLAGLLVLGGLVLLAKSS